MNNLELVRMFLLSQRRSLEGTAGADRSTVRKQESQEVLSW